MAAPHYLLCDPAKNVTGVRAYADLDTNIPDSTCSVLEQYNGSGQVYVYDKSGDTWSLTDTIISPITSTYNGDWVNLFGLGVEWSHDGSQLIIETTKLNSSNYSKTAVYDSSLNHLGYFLTPSNGSAGYEPDRSNNSGDTYVGFHVNSTGPAPNDGYIYHYYLGSVYTGTGAYKAETQKLWFSTNTYYGRELAEHDEVQLLITSDASLIITNYINQGFCVVWKNGASGYYDVQVIRWSQHSWYGRAALSGNGEYLAFRNPDNFNHLHIYKINAAGTNFQLFYTIESDPLTEDYRFYDFRFNQTGSVLVVLARTHDSNNDPIVTYIRQGSVWVKSQILVPPDRTNPWGDGLAKLRFSNDGTTIVLFGKDIRQPEKYPQVAHIWHGGPGNYTYKQYIRTPIITSRCEEQWDRFSIDITGDGSRIAISDASKWLNTVITHTFDQGGGLPLIDGLVMNIGDRFISEELGGVCEVVDDGSISGNWVVKTVLLDPALDDWFYVEEGTNYQDKVFQAKTLPDVPIPNITGYWVEDGCDMGCARGFIWEGAWQTGQPYVVQDVSLQCNSSVVHNNGTTYVCIAEHTSDAASEPGVGASWQTYWDVMAQVGADGPAGIEGLGYQWQSDWATATSYQTQNPGTVQAADVVTHNGSSYVCILDHTSDSTSEPGVGASWETYWDPYTISAGGGTGNIVWRQYWISGNTYEVNDLVSHDGYSYICMQAHTADDFNKPDPEWDYEPGGEYWYLVSMGQNEEEKGFFDGLMDGVYDWMGDLWDINPLLALAAGAGILFAGVKILEMFEEDGTGDGNANQSYNGSPGYNGAFTQPTLPDLVDSLCEWAELPSYDSSSLPATPVNLTLNNITSARSILDQLSSVYQFDMVDSGGTLKFVPRDTAPVKTLSLDNMGYASGDELPAPYTAKRFQGIDLPRSVSITYFSETIDHNQFVQKAEFMTHEDGQDISLNVPFTMTDSNAKKAAEQVLINSHIERMHYAFTGTYDQIELEPGDVVTTPMGDLRILEVVEEEEGLLNFVCASADFNTAAYDVSGEGVQTPPTQTNVPIEIGYSQTLFLEVPPLSADESTPRLLTATHGYGKVGWPGATVFRSDDAGASYDSQFFTSNQASIGIVKAADTELLPYTDYHTWDETSTITVEMKTGSLSNRSAEDVYRGYNRCMVGEEIISFRNATLVAADKYELTGLLRGRRGTEWKAVEGHSANELFVLLDDKLGTYEYPVSDINKPFKTKTVTVGSSLSVTTPLDVQPYGENMRPWRVGNPTATKTGNNWAISFTERPRLDNDFKDMSDAPHDPDHGGFNIAILNPADDTLKRFVVQQTTNWTYTEQMQIDDFGSAQSSIKVRVTQLSQKTGNGHPYDFTA